MAKAKKAFVNEFVIGFGFLSGLFLYAGIDIEGSVINAILPLISDPVLTGYLLAIPSLIFILSFFAAYCCGGELGLVAVFLSFSAGLIISSIAPAGALLLAISVIIGIIVDKKK